MLDIDTKNDKNWQVLSQNLLHDQSSDEIGQFHIGIQIKTLVNKISQKSKSITPSIMLLNQGQDELNLSEKEITSRKLLIAIPLRNMVEKLKLKKLDRVDRRRSCYGSIFGKPTLKEQLNYPTIVCNHRKVHGQEFAMNSFAQIYKTRKLTQKFTQNLITYKFRGLVKKGSFVEYDQMERPPSYQSPAKISKKVKQKSRHQIEKERNQLKTATKLNRFVQDAEMRRKVLLPNLPKAQDNNNFNGQRCITEACSQKRSAQFSSRTTTHSRPYLRENYMLERRLKSTIYSIHSLHSCEYNLNINQ